MKAGSWKAITYVFSNSWTNCSTHSILFGGMQTGDSDSASGRTAMMVERRLNEEGDL